MTILWVSLAALLPSLITDSSKEDRGDRERLQGSWKVVTLIDDGKELSDDKVKGVRLTFDGDRFSFKGGEEEFRGSFKVDSSTKPRQINTIFIAEDEKEKGRAQGIYELDGKRLRIAWHHGEGDRPREFSSKPGSKVRLIVLERGSAGE